MRGVLGYSVFFIGLVFLIQAFFPGSLSPIFGSSTPVASLSSPQPHPARTTIIPKTTQPSRVASFSPGEKLSAGSGRGMAVMAFFSSQFTALNTTPAIAKTASHEVAARDVTLGPWRSAVVTSATDTSPVVPKVAAPLDSRQRATLARQIQAELKRVGCYGGAIDGSWGGASKRAMVAFIERVNASLPLNDPDDIMLLLVRSQASGICDNSCPIGQTLSKNNRCVPDAIVAHNAKRPPDEPTQTTHLVASSTTRTTSDDAGLWPPSPVQPARDAWPLPGRMSIGGPGLDRAAEVPGGAYLPAAGESKLAYTDPSDGTTVTVEVGQGLTEGAVITETPNPELAAKPKYRARAKASNGSSRKNRYADERRYRSVQHLFQHPLGRL